MSIRRESAAETADRFRMLREQRERQENPRVRPSIIALHEIVIIGQLGFVRMTDMLYVRLFDGRCW